MLGTKVMVTGGAGFIGSELVRQLAATECRVLVVDNLVNGRRENLQGSACELVELEVADIRDLERMRVLLRGVDVVFHLACLGVRHSIHSPLENHEVNATGTLRLLIAARETGIKRRPRSGRHRRRAPTSWRPSRRSSRRPSRRRSPPAGLRA